MIDEWIVKQLVPIVETTHSLLIATHKSTLSSIELATLDSAYDVFLGLQVMDSRLVASYVDSLFVSSRIFTF